MLFQFLLSRPYSIGERIYSVTGLAFRFLFGILTVKGKGNFLLIRTKICVLNRLLRNVSLAYLMLTTHADKTLKEILSSIVEHVPILVRRQPDG